nr:WD40 repeat domain-containing protein [Alicyclobacillus mali (ex Roth et al. 2021)]
MRRAFVHEHNGCEVIDVHPGLRTALAALAISSALAGCGTAPATPTPPHSTTQDDHLPEGASPGALVACGSTEVAEYTAGNWVYFPASSILSAPSTLFESVDVSPTGEVAAVTSGSPDASTPGMSSANMLWTYRKGWHLVSVRNDTDVQLHTFGPDGSLYVVPDDGTLAGIWKQTASGWQQLPGSAQLGYIASLAWSPKAVLTVVSVPQNGATTVWQFEGDHFVAVTSDHAPFAADSLTVGFAPNGDLAVGTSAHGVWIDEGGRFVQPGGVACPVTDVGQFAWSPKGVLTVSGKAGSQNGLWQFSGGRWQQVQGAGPNIGADKIYQFGWSPQGVLTVSDASRCQIFELVDGHWTPVWTKTHATDRNATPPKFAWSPTGTLVTSGGDLGGLWELTPRGNWTEIGGKSSPFAGEVGVSFTFAPTRFVHA